MFYVSGMVYNDLLQNPLIVPVKKLTGHTKYDDFGVMAVSWHPTQPWLFSAGADGYTGGADEIDLKGGKRRAKCYYQFRG